MYMADPSVLQLRGKSLATSQSLCATCADVLLSGMSLMVMRFSGCSWLSRQLCHHCALLLGLARVFSARLGSGAKATQKPSSNTSIIVGAAFLFHTGRLGVTRRWACRRLLLLEAASGCSAQHGLPRRGASWHGHILPHARAALRDSCSLCSLVADPATSPGGALGAPLCPWWMVLLLASGCVRLNTGWGSKQ